MARIAWGITGAGHHLRETFDLFVRAKEVYGDRVSVTSFVSRAAEEVTRVYGLFQQLERVSPGGYMEEVILEREQGWSYPKTGRFSRGIYDALFVSPTTSNTIAKIAHGIADSLVTNAVAHAVKGGVLVFIVPVDIAGSVKSPVPYFINRDLCTGCQECAQACPNDAIDEQIDYLRCNGCGLCKDVCDYNAIQEGTVNLVVRDIDKNNVRTLRDSEGITILDNPHELEKALLTVI
ncbi:MAG: dihydromethanopterin reductase (acceptor) [Halobacteriota archaeon]|jgi:dihydromethanopterin reductase (acceptor)